MQWQPHITVATVIEDAGRFLFVEEFKAGRMVLTNQPDIWKPTSRCVKPQCGKHSRRPDGTWS